ncbi:MAG: hypothetical protein JOY71_22135 [Acetobacteraceae bacterium]|nr:hypothetical protein [Acetobacteraceae bacterium]MBV8590574.1 hypothetical protein [Acetobacteraceae bacterium]
MPLRRSVVAGPALPGALERASAVMARLDQALASHPLGPAFLYRTRLEAVRRQAAADGQRIDAWHLAAVLEGLRLQLDHVRQVYDRNSILDAARDALGLHQWISRPDEDQQRAIAKAEQALSEVRSSSGLVSAAQGFHEWLAAGGARAPMRAALIRYWVKHKRFRAPIPITGPRALSADAPKGEAEWICTFLHAVADEATDYHQILVDIEREWVSARKQRVAGRRSNSRAPMAIDVMAAAPLVSATTLAKAVGMSIQAATLMLDQFVADGIAVEVTHRSARRLFGINGLAPLRYETDAPRRSKPGPGRGRWRAEIEVDENDASPVPLPPITPIERKAFDYSELEDVLAQLDQVNRSTKQKLDAMVMARTLEPDLHLSR